MGIVGGVDKLLDEKVMPELAFIRNILSNRVDRLEADAHEHTSQIRELYAINAAVQARLDNLEKKT